MPGKDEAVTAHQINELILDFLIVHDRVELVETFLEESGMSRVDFKDLSLRQEVQKFIQMGEIKQAIAAIISWDPVFFDENPNIHLELLLMQLVELIRAADFDADMTSFDPALSFAKTEILPILQGSNERIDKDLYTRSFEETMALMCFPIKQLPDDLASQLLPSRRADLAEKINRTMLLYHETDGVSKLTKLVWFNTWGQRKMEDHGLSTQDLIKIGEL